MKNKKERVYFLEKVPGITARCVKLVKVSKDRWRLIHEGQGELFGVGVSKKDIRSMRRVGYWKTSKRCRKAYWR